MSKVVLWSSSAGDVPANLPFTNNYAATTNPAATNDSTQGYSVGSQWINTAKSIAWSCISAAAAAAVWVTDAVQQATPVARNTATTLTVSDIEAGIITTAPAGAINLTLPLASAMTTEFPSAPGTSIDFIVINTSGANAATIVTNTGWTLVGLMAVNANTSARFRALSTAANTWTLYRIS